MSQYNFVKIRENQKKLDEINRVLRLLESSLLHLKDFDYYSEISRLCNSLDESIYLMTKRKIEHQLQSLNPNSGDK